MVQEFFVDKLYTIGILAYMWGGGACADATIAFHLIENSDLPYYSYSINW